MKYPMAAPLVFQFKNARKGGAQETVRLIYNSVFRSLLRGVTNIINDERRSVYILQTVHPRILQLSII